MNIGIFGGAFNPPHNGHVQTVVLASKFFDEVWVSPCYSHTLGKHLENNQARLEMTKLAFDGLFKVKITDFEIKYQISQGTLESIRVLKRLHPRNKFTVIIGQDNADIIYKWKNATKLIEEVPFMVIPRKGYNRNFNDTAWYVLNHHQYLRDVPAALEIMEYSSTDARNEISAGKKPNNLPDKVYQYIRNHNLYEKF